jgi:predicted metal-dependent hydrolase
MQGLFERGVEEFNGQFFFEAHDTWEELWRETLGPDKLFYQGLIQTAVGFYHLSNKNYKGACSQFGKALAKFGQYLPVYHGIDTQQVVNRLEPCLRDAELLRDGGVALPVRTSTPCIRL